MSDDGRDRTLLFVIGGLGVVVAGGLCLVAGVLFALAANEPGATDSPEPPPLPTVPVGEPIPGPSPAPSPTPNGPMPARYRPGPYVSIEGYLPDGRLSPAPPSMNNGPLTGRTIDNPWIVGGAELRAGAAPDASQGTDAPALRIPQEARQEVLTILAGVPNRLSVDADSGAGPDGAVQGLLIAYHGYPGYFFLPASVDTELGPIHVAGVDATEAHFGIDSPQRPDGTPIDTPYDVTMYVAAIDLAGNVSPYVTQRLQLMPVGTGDVEVTLTMSRATDLDLYVVDPSQVVVYYANTSSASGGQLDLDANAGCSGNMGVNNEHVFWPRNGAVAGTYTVRVANYRSCIGDAAVDYRITVNNCGETAVFSGTFDGPGNSDSCDRPPGTQRGWCQQVVEFDVSPCTPTALPPGQVL